MKTEWDYTELADAYLQRPDYASDALERVFAVAGQKAGDHVCDIGAGVAHLTLHLARKDFVVDAVEPNDAMRANGIKRTTGLANVSWSEASGRPSGAYDFVSFGSSFNACDRAAALRETWRLLKPGKWFACLWNHRDLNDPVQADIESIIKKHIPDYAYGTRREDQTAVIAASDLFENIQTVQGRIMHTCTVEAVVEAWRSHATLHRQAGEAFPAIIEKIASYLHDLCKAKIDIPYTTHAWVAQRKC